MVLVFLLIIPWVSFYMRREFYHPREQFATLKLCPWRCEVLIVICHYLQIESGKLSVTEL